MKTNKPTSIASEFARIVTPVSLASDSQNNALPTRMKILNWGVNANAKGQKIVVNQKLVDSMSSPVYAFREIALDYEHNTYPLSTTYKETVEPRPVAAFLSVDVVDGQGVFVDVVRWTDSGLQNAKNYCDLSAVPVMDGAGNVVAIISVALTRAGAVPDITFEQAALAAMEAFNNPEGKQMNWKEIVAKQLGMDPNCTDDELMTAWKKQLPAETSTEMSATEISGIVTTAVAASTAALSARLDQSEKQKIIDDGRADGKAVCLSAELLAKMSVDDVKAHIAALPVAVPLAPLTPVVIADGKTVSLSATELLVCQSLGITPEAYAKEKK